MHTENTPLQPGGDIVLRLPRRDVDETVILFHEGNRFRGKFINTSASGLLIETDAQPLPSRNDELLLLFQMEGRNGNMGKLTIKARVARKATENKSSIARYGMRWISAECYNNPAPLQAFKERIVPDAMGIIRVHPKDNENQERRFVYTFTTKTPDSNAKASNTSIATSTAPAPKQETPLALTDPVDPAPIVEPPKTTQDQALEMTPPLSEPVVPEKPKAKPAMKISVTPGMKTPERAENERRASTRTVQLIAIEYALRGSRNSGFLTDISRTGAFVQTRDSLPSIDSVLSLSIKVDRYPIRMSAKVVRHTQSEYAGMPSGFGVEFLLHKDPYRNEEFMRALEMMT